MRGIKGQENYKFNAYFKIIQETAEKMNSIFFTFAGEGREFFYADIEGEDLSGWLIPQDKADAFEYKWNQSNDWNNLLEWADYFTFVIWKKNGNNNVTIEFQKFDYEY